MKWYNIKHGRKGADEIFERDQNHGTAAFDVFKPKGEIGTVQLYHKTRWCPVSCIAMMVTTDSKSDTVTIVEAGIVQVTLYDPQRGRNVEYVKFDWDEDIPMAVFKLKWTLLEGI